MTEVLEKKSFKESSKMKGKLLGILTVLLLLLVVTANADVEVNETNFPDPNFRECIANLFDKDGDGILSDAELEHAIWINCDKKSITSIEGINLFPFLEGISCNYNQLVSLNLSNNANLKYLDFSFNSLLTSVEITNCTGLEEIIIVENHRLTSLNVNNCVATKSLRCYYNALNSLKIENCTSLAVLYCYANKLTSLDVSRLNSLESLWCGEN